MPLRRLFSFLIKPAIVIAAGIAIYLFWRWHPTSTIVMPDDDDIAVMPRVRVSAGTIGRATLHRYISSFGNVEPEPATSGKSAAEVSITVPTAALIASVGCIEGQRVKVGEPLFELDPRSIDASVMQAHDRLAAAEESLKHFQNNPEDKTGREIDLMWARHERDLAATDLASLVAQRAICKVAAPMSGTIVQLNIHPGEVASASTTALRIVDLDRLVVAVAVPSSQLNSIKIGQAAEIQDDVSENPAAASTPPTTIPTEHENRRVQTTVTFIDPGVDSKSNMGSVDVALPGDSGFHPGQILSVRIVAEEHANCLAVPVESLSKDSQGHPSIAMIVRDFRWAVRQTVEPGVREGDLVEIRSPDLKGGEDIVTTGAYALPDKSMIEVIK